MLKIVLYSEKSSDFDEIWYSSKFLNRQSRDQIVKIYKIEDGTRPPYWPYLSSRLTDYCEILHGKQKSMVIEVT